nr:retrotransposon protein putative Ty1-copia subclass [Tanacetum cinerariifolium]
MQEFVEKKIVKLLDTGNIYAVRCTIHDVVFAQNITSRFQQNPSEPHWTVVKTILKYLRNTKDIFLVYGGTTEAELRVDCYCDARFETDRDDIKSQTGYVFVMNEGAVDWKSKVELQIRMANGIFLKAVMSLQRSNKNFIWGSFMRLSTYIKLGGFKEFELMELRVATNRFSWELNVSESGEKIPNMGLTKLSQEFGENVLDATKKIEKLITDKREIKGFPATSLGLAAQTASSKIFKSRVMKTPMLKMGDISGMTAENGRYIRRLKGQ